MLPGRRPVRLCPSASVAAAVHSLFVGRARVLGSP